MPSFRKRGQIWYYRFVDGNGNKVERKGCSDLRATQNMAREAESHAALIRSGFIDPKAERYRVAELQPLSVHLNAFELHLINKNTTRKHAEHTANRARRVAALVKGASVDETDPRRIRPSARTVRSSVWTEFLETGHLSDLTVESAQSALATLKAAGRSHQTCNHHRVAIKSFMAWAKETNRVREYELGGVVGYNVEEDRRHDRRTIGLDELRSLIKTAHEGPVYREIDGPTRALVYQVASLTGARYSELAAMLPISFQLNVPEPIVKVSAGYTKNGETAEFDLPLDLAADLRAYLQDKPADKPAFPLPAKGAAMLRVDLKAAGIPYRDASGLVFDFHSLRCEHATLLDLAGVSPRVVQKKMRHSKLELTGRYTRPRVVDLKQATDALPTLRPDDTPSREVGTLGATGTDGERIKDRFAHHLPTKGDGSRRIESDFGGIDRSPKDRSPNPNLPQDPGLGDPRQILRGSFREAPPGFEPGNNGFANRCLTAWLRRLRRKS
jgi:site-specific recombinase XerD